jgi:hypothetical protein
MTWKDDPALKQEAEAERTRHRGPGKTFTLTPLRDMTLDTTASYLVEDIIPRNGLVVVWGPPKSGKSFWTFDLTAHIALGREYRGRRVEEGTVIYLAAEGERGIRNRSVAFQQERLGDDDAPPFFVMTTSLDLIADIDTLIAAVRAQLGHTPCSAVTIDTLNRTLRGSEGKDEDMTAYITAADRLREEFGCTVILIHHCGGVGTRPRGHTSLTAAVDARIAIRREPNTKTFFVTVELQRDGPDDTNPFSCQLEPVTIGSDIHGKTITSCVVEHLDTAAPKERQKSRKLPAAQKKCALDLLRDAINTGGEIPPANNHIPANTRCVREDLWRQYCYQGGISTGGQEAKRNAFTNAADNLIGNGFVGSWESWCWPVDPNTTQPA